MSQATSIEKPEVSEQALSVFMFLFWSRIMTLEKQKGAVTTFAIQAKIKRLRYIMKKFILSRPYSFFRICTLPPNGNDPENSEISLTIKNFDFFIKDLEPKRYVLVIHNTWDTFSAYEETIDKNLIPMTL